MSVFRDGRQSGERHTALITINLYRKTPFLASGIVCPIRRCEVSLGRSRVCHGVCKVALNVARRYDHPTVLEKRVVFVFVRNRVNSNLQKLRWLYSTRSGHLDFYFSNSPARSIRYSKSAGRFFADFDFVSLTVRISPTTPECRLANKPNWRWQRPS